MEGINCSLETIIKKKYENLHTKLSTLIPKDKTKQVAHDRKTLFKRVDTQSNAEFRLALSSGPNCQRTQF
jgi:hypothetical protein